MENSSLSNTTTTQTSGGIGFAGLLGIVFIVLKLTGVIAWSWLWVLAPFWIPLAVAVACFVVAGLLVIAADQIKGKKRK